MCNYSFVGLYVYLSAEFGDAEVDDLTTYFKQVGSENLTLTVTLIPDQWTMLKNRLYEKGYTLHSTTWPEINYYNASSLICSA